MLISSHGEFVCPARRESPRLFGQEDQGNVILRAGGAIAVHDGLFDLHEMVIPCPKASHVEVAHEDILVMLVTIISEDPMPRQWIIVVLHLPSPIPQSMQLESDRIFTVPDKPEDGAIP